MLPKSQKSLFSVKNKPHYDILTIATGKNPLSPRDYPGHLLTLSKCWSRPEPGVQKKPRLFTFQHLPEIKVEVVYRHQTLQFRPPIEEIRMKYFSQLKRFLAIPNNFRGVTDVGGETIFPKIVERNSHRFGHLFGKAEELFQRLDKVKDRFAEWVALGSVDVDDYIATNFKTAQDWELNFKASKAGLIFGHLVSRASSM